MVMNRLTAQAEANVREYNLYIDYCDDTLSLAYNLGLETDDDFPRIFGPMTLESALAMSAQFRRDGVPTGLNVSFNKHFPETLPVHELLITLHDDNPDSNVDSEPVVFICANHHNDSQCWALPKHGARGLS